MLSEVKGIVLRVVDFKETDRLLTVYTEEMGLITAMAKGARSLKSRKMASTQQLCYSSFVLFGEGDKLYVKEASLIESFYSIRDTLDGLALAMYVSEVIADVGTADGDTELLRLTLNTLFAISKGTYDTELVKGAFEMRLLSILGFMPELLACKRSGAEGGEFFFDIMAAALECSECHKLSSAGGERLAEAHESSILCILTESARNALLYSLYAPLEKLFSFKLSGEDRQMFSRAAEEYLLHHLERGYKTLDFYNEVKR